MEVPRTTTRRKLILGAVGTYALPSAASELTIHISNGEWAPFMGTSLPYHGFVSRIVTEAFRLEGVSVHYEFFPWARAYYVAQHGEFDASIGWYWNEDRAQDFLFSDPVFVESQVLFFLKDRPLPWSALSDLQGKSIGAVRGYTYGDDFKKLEESKRINVQRTSSDAQNLKMLLAGRIDAVVISRAVGTRLVQGLGATGSARIIFDPRPINSGPLHLIFPKCLDKSAEWLAVFNRSLKKLKSAGLVERYSHEN